VGVEEIWRKQVAAMHALGPKLGPVLVQLPPSFTFRGDLLAAFLAMAAGDGVATCLQAALGGAGAHARDDEGEQRKKVDRCNDDGDDRTR
jgi:uncharacterized protein YecE (DUF72 family)